MAHEAPPQQNEEMEQQPVQRTWRMPQAGSSTMDLWETGFPLRVYNSLTRTKVPFVPIDGKRVVWYTCGPTVYNHSHMGHARTFLTFDIIRRIMTDYFGYEVTQAMNITDIDDKIIIKSGEEGVDFREVSRRYETSFFEDIRALGIQMPDVVTRVSEYVPQVLDYIGQIIANGHAYEANGSVYFDTAAYEAAGHRYGKLLPENVGNSELLAEGEGSLSVGQQDKRSPHDFALWKASKPGEPKWDSPWGEGRPGWHIECSVMASDALEQFADGRIDVHSGGVDLKFPHHDNEIAQTESYYGFQQWVQYFWHAGHLMIKGLKMSKSLKNFITIKEALQINSARQIRLLFLMHRYNQPLEYSDNAMAEPLAMERLFDEFFNNVKIQSRQHPMQGAEGSTVDERPLQRWDDAEKALAARIDAAKLAVREALSDDFDTPRVIDTLADLVRDVNRYLERDQTPVTLLLESAAAFVDRILRVFGLIEPVREVGLGVGGAGAGGSEALAPVLDAVARFRDQIKAAARASGDVDILALCDALRDDALPAVGVRLEDRDGGAVWKLVDPEQVELERARASAAEEAKAAEQQRLADRRAYKDRLNSLPAGQMFREEQDDDGNPVYSAFDDRGVPTHTADGEPLSKGAKKKAEKKWAKRAQAVGE